jgi:AraC family transcriptional activator FtrA
MTQRTTGEHAMRHRVVTIASQPTSLFEVAIGHEVFRARPDLPGWHYEHQVCGPAPAERSSDGIALVPAGGLELTEHADTVIVAGGSVSTPVDRCIVDAVRVAFERGARVVSFCTGAFVLAEAGLLDGLEATTHHKYADLLRQRFPNVRVDPDVLFIDHGPIATSAGTTAGIDLALHLVRRDLGADAARRVAHDMVLSTQRAGHQAQRIAATTAPLVDGDPIAPLLDWLVEHLHEPISIGTMARQVAMSERTFARRFKEQTGTSPVRWLTDQRTAHALELLETTNTSIDEIAALSGFSSTSKLREHVRATTGAPPSEYRRASRLRHRTTSRTPARTSNGFPSWQPPVYGRPLPHAHQRADGAGDHRRRPDSVADASRGI